jgi:protein TonB
LILCFASPMPTAPGEFVRAYLVAGTGGAAGGGGARGGASGTGAIHAGRGPLATPESVSADRRKQQKQKKLADAAMRPAPTLDARKPRRRIEELHSEVAIIAPMHSIAPAPPVDSEHDGRGHGRDESPGGASGSRSGADSGNGNGTGGGAGYGIGGGGDGGDPNSTAHADYARNPLPVYPAVARRRAEQGTVTVSVLVGADGSVERAEVEKSSGFDALDDAALETVRARWRFVPARRGGIAVESWVLVPIRFALTEANAAR